MYSIKKNKYVIKDKEVSDAINAEFERLNNGIELIASENVVSSAVLEAVGSVMTNKYAEGYAHSRYYGGCVNVDIVEDLAISRLQQLFKCSKDDEFEYACNVQPHCGSSANMAVYMAFLKPGDKVLGMDLSAGGHLTHGCRVNFSGKLYDFISYGIDEEGNIDYDALELQANKEQPKLIIAGASAYARIIDFKRLKEIANSCGALLMADIAHIAGLIVTGNHPTPIGYADFITSTTHKTLRGPRGGIILCKKEYEKKINSSIFPGIQGGPLMHIISAKAVAFGEALDGSFISYQNQVVQNAKVMAQTLLENGVDLVSNGTDNHLLLLDLRSLNVTGAQAEEILEEVGITTNKNGIPNDPLPPKVTSGIRIGTPAITTRGFLEQDAKEVAQIMADVLKNTQSQEVLESAKARVKILCKNYPLYMEE